MQPNGEKTGKGADGEEREQLGKKDKERERDEREPFSSQCSVSLCDSSKLNTTNITVNRNL